MSMILNDDNYRQWSPTIYEMIKKVEHALRSAENDRDAAIATALVLKSAYIDVKAQLYWATGASIHYEKCCEMARDDANRLLIGDQEK